VVTTFSRASAIAFVALNQTKRAAARYKTRVSMKDPLHIAGFCKCKSLATVKRYCELIATTPSPDHGPHQIENKYA
jgi:hypothetical protein